MRFFRQLPLIATLVALNTSSLSIRAQQASNSAESAVILHMLQKQADDWNRGDLEAFATGYKNSPDILFMGRTIRRGYNEMLAGYRRSFPTRVSMGMLTFSDLAVQPLDENFATVTGRFHLARTAAGGGDTSGYYMLVVEKTPAGWKIIRDDTTDDPQPR